MLIWIVRIVSGLAGACLLLFDIAIILPDSGTLATGMSSADFDTLMWTWTVASLGGYFTLAFATRRPRKPDLLPLAGTSALLALVFTAVAWMNPDGRYGLVQFCWSWFWQAISLGASFAFLRTAWFLERTQPAEI